MATNTVTYGLKNVCYSLATRDSDGEWSFDNPETLPGAQELSTEVIGGSQSVYADDIVIATLSQNAGRTISLKVTEVSDEFKASVLGYKKLSNGNLVEVANSPVKTFALGFEFQGDAKARRIWFYLCSVTPINEATKTKGESIEANEITLNIIARPIEVGNNLITHIVANSGDTNYSEFLSVAPQLPTIGN